MHNKELGLRVLGVLLGLGFVVASLDKILGLSMVKGMFEGFFGATLGGPMVYLAIVLELAGGLMLILNWHRREAAAVLGVLILVAFVVTFKLGTAPNFIATLREIMVMNTGGGATAVNFAYFAGLLTLVLSGCEQCE